MLDDKSMDLGMRVVPLEGGCGAMIEGVDLTREISDAEFKFVKQAWDDNLVLVFRGQNISEDDQLRFAQRFGPLGDRKAPPDPLRDRAEGVKQVNPKILLVSNIKENGKPIGAFGDGEMWFHIDSGYSVKPYLYTFIYGLTLPSTGGNTLFSNMYKAAAAVPPALREKLKGRRALHIHEYKRSERVDLSEDISGVPHFWHPVFTRHPSTNRESLFVDRLMTQAIEGLEPAESEDVLAQLYEIGERKEFIYEHVWQLGDLVMWDNLATIHARTYFSPEEPRLLRRCTVEGSGVWGREEA
jgi:taurine dioxygenase